jgi:hypothetical protein
LQDRGRSWARNIRATVIIPNLVCVKENSVPVIFQAPDGTHFARHTLEFGVSMICGCGEGAGWIEDKVTYIRRDSSKPR